MRLIIIIPAKTIMLIRPKRAKIIIEIKDIKKRDTAKTVSEKLQA